MADVPPSLWDLWLTPDTGPADWFVLCLENEPLSVRVLGLVSKCRLRWRG